MLNQLITPMNYTIVKDAIASLLLNERDNQVSIAEAQGMSESDIYNLINFEVYSALWRPLSVDDMPAVSVYAESISFPTDRQYGDENWAEVIYNIDCFTVGQNAENEYGEIVKSAEQIADERINYLLSQVYKVLCGEANFYKNAKGIVKNPFVLSMTRISTPELENEKYVGLGKRLQFRLEMPEPTELLSLVEIKEIYIKLNVRDEVIDPFIRIKYEEE